MKINTLDLPETGQQFQGTLPLKEYDLPDDRGEKWEKIDYQFHAQLIDGECLISGSLLVQLQLPCSRCLDPLSLRQDIRFVHSYQVENDLSIDLTPDIREDTLLSLPIVTTCQQFGKQCKGKDIADRIGKNQFAEQRKHDVWGELDKLKENKENGSSKKKDI